MVFTSFANAFLVYNSINSNFRNSFMFFYFLYNFIILFGNLCDIIILLYIILNLCFYQLLNLNNLFKVTTFLILSIKKELTMSNILELSNYIEKNLVDIKIIIRNNLKDRNNNVTNLMDKLPAEEGKLIRALLVLLGSSFGNIEKQRLFEISAAIELLHSATLVHDDIVDETNTRRGHETLHRKYDLKAGLFAGDYLFSQSYVLFSKNCSPKSIYNVSKTIKFVCKSEISQYFTINSFDASIRDYLRRINGKCASLFSLSLSIGAEEGNADTKIVKTLIKIGYYAGMAFQLIDDLLDISSSSDILGKPAGNDLKQGTYNLPIIYELKNGNTELLNLLKNKQVDEAILLLQSSEGYKKSKEFAKKYTNKALKLLDTLPDIYERYLLKQLLEKLFNRNY